MGGGSFDKSAYRAFYQSTQGKSTSQIYTSQGMKKNLDPMGVKIRESRDSSDNPHSTPLIVGLDVSGTMGIIADMIAREGLGVLFNGILDRKPITDPHIMFMGIGDVAMHDTAPLQVSQFEADNRIVEQLTQLYLEHGGGGNGSESYHLPWYFAACHTAHDSMEKRGKRGYLFTVGDESVPPPLTKEQVKRVTGDDLGTDELSAIDILQLAQRLYDVYHVIITEGSYARSYLSSITTEWRDILGEHVILLSDYRALSETIVIAIEIAEGRDAKESSTKWGANSQVVFAAVKSLPKGYGSPRLLGQSAA